MNELNLTKIQAIPAAESNDFILVYRNGTTYKLKAKNLFAEKEINEKLLALESKVNENNHKEVFLKETANLKIKIDNESQATEKKLKELKNNQEEEWKIHTNEIFLHLKNAQNRQHNDVLQTLSERIIQNENIQKLQIDQNKQTEEISQILGKQLIQNEDIQKLQIDQNKQREDISQILGEQKNYKQICKSLENSNKNLCESVEQISSNIYGEIRNIDIHKQNYGVKINDLQILYSELTNTLNSAQKYIESLESKIQGLNQKFKELENCSPSRFYKIGSIVFWPIDHMADEQWVLLEGQKLFIKDYEELFNIIKYKYGGEGDYFNLPDVRGKFIRCWSNQSNIDENREIGSTQEDSIKQHRHKFLESTNEELKILTGVPFDFFEITSVSGPQLSVEKNGLGIERTEKNGLKGFISEEEGPYFSIGSNESSEKETRPWNIAFACYMKIK